METNNKYILIPLWIIVVCLIFFILYIWKNILSLVFLTFILLILFSGIFRFFFQFTKNTLISVIISFGIFIGFFAWVSYIISVELDSFTQNTDKITQGFEKLTNIAWPYLWNIQEISFEEISQHIDIKKTGSYLLSIVWWFFGWFMTVGILAIFLFLERKLFLKKIKKILDTSSRKKFRSIYQKIYEDINVFILSKFFIAFVNASMSYIVMLLFWVEYALLFALFVFFLDFIPTVWWAIAMALPFLYSFVQFDTTLMSLGLLVCLLIPQTISGNFLEPRIMWKRLNLSSTIIILSLLFWSSLWWIMWAFLSVPIMAVITIILSKFESTKGFAIMFSKDGEIEEK